MSAAELANTIAIVNVVATVLAVIASPLIALWIGGKLQRRQQRAAAKQQAFATVMQARHDQLSDAPGKLGRRPTEQLASMTNLRAGDHA